MKEALLLILGSFLGLLIEILRRKLTKADQSDLLNKFTKLAELYKSLKEQNLSPNELREFEKSLNSRTELYTEFNRIASGVDPLGRLYRDASLSQQEMNQLAGEAARIANRDLEEVYNILLRRRSDYDLDFFVESQNNWLAYRDKEVEFRRARRMGGSVAPMVAALAYESLTRQRIEYLSNLLEEGTL